MSMTAKFTALVGMSLVAATISTAALAAGKRADTAAESQVRALLRQMDKDKNGTVSKDEFMQYMSQMFDRLDNDSSNQLERKELRRMSDPNSMLCHDLHMC
jgi:Ca2+-binding EF-hand superfamily protein